MASNRNASGVEKQKSTWKRESWLAHPSIANQHPPSPIKDSITQSECLIVGLTTVI
uniref:Uncharacterized protein n=1 Tax=Arundo donax TaxID=35708 RepID=A0A0A8XW11_ARUDO